MAFRDKLKPEPTSTDANAPTTPTPDALPTSDVLPSSDSSSSSSNSGSSSTNTNPDPNIAPSTHPNGEQSVDRAEDKVLPDSTPDEIAPVPDAGTGDAPKQAKPAPSSTGYRVAPGKSITGGNGDALDAGAEIGEQHVVGGDKRLQELVKAGYVVKAEKKAEGAQGEPHGVDGNKVERQK